MEMELSNGTNTISDERFQAVREEMVERHDDEYEIVHNGSGRSEELPSQLRERHDREERQLEHDRKYLGIAEWLKFYPDTARTYELISERDRTPEYIRREGIDFITNSSTEDQRKSFAQLEHIRNQTGPWAKTLPPQQEYQRAENGFVMREQNGVSYRAPLNLNTEEHRAEVPTVKSQTENQDQTPRQAQQHRRGWSR
jgi:hypothetical protein